MWGELALSFKDGNVYVIAVFVLSFIACTLLVERVIMLQFVYNLNFKRFIIDFRKAVGSSDYERAMNICRSTSLTSLPKIALRALEAVENDPTTVKSTIEEETLEFLPRLEQRLSALPVLATLVLLVGVLGTIDSLWWAFHSIDVLDTAKKQASLANGIAGSLNPTAISLLVSLLMISGHHYLNSVAVGIVERMHLGVAVLHNLLVPDEVVHYAAAPAAMAAAAPAYADDGDANLSSGSNDDAFDDAVVDDIKDEEEII